MPSPSRSRTLVAKKGARSRRPALGMLTARDLMTRDVYTVSPETSVEKIAAALTRHGISALPVVDRKRRVIGMVSEGDLMRQFTHSSEQRRAWWLHMLADGDDLAPEFLEYVRLDKRRAGDMMQTAMVTALKPEEFLGGARSSGSALPHARLSLTAEGTVRIEGDGEVLYVLEYSTRLDAAVALVAALAERFEDRFEVMPAGTLVTTGSMTVPFVPKHRITADYGPLGVNELIFSDI